MNMIKLGIVGLGVSVVIALAAALYVTSRGNDESVRRTECFFIASKAERVGLSWQDRAKYEKLCK